MKEAAKGFSAIELMVIIAIVGILVSVAWLRLAQLAPRYRLEGAARAFAVEIQKAHGRAVSEGKCFMVALNTATNSYQLQSKAATTPCGNTGYAADAQEPGSKQIDNVLTMDDGSGGTPVNPIFTARGGSEDTGGVFPTIRLSNSLGDGRLVLVNKVGRVIVR
jgi:Tfp pilus assembly protein FimT